MLLGFAGAGHASALGQAIDAHIDAPRFAAASWGISVVSLDDGRVVYGHDDGKLMLPASTAKLYTAAFALDRLGAEYRTHTDVLAAGEIRRGRLRGDLVLRGRGDPTLTGDAWADQLAQQVAAAGVTRIDGAVVGDDTAFAGPPIGSGWEASDLQEYYGATASGLTVDENTLVADVRDNAVTVTPTDAALTLAEQPSDTPAFYRPPGSSTLHVLGAQPRKSRLSLPDPALIAARRLTSALEKRGVTVKKDARSVHWPIPAPTGTPVATLASPALSEILSAGLKRSQNMYLQSVFLLTGAEASDQTAPLTEDRAAAGLKAWLGGHGIGPSATTLEEGTGLSRHDLTTAGSLTHLLATVDSPAFRALLPVAGTDGTLARRMKGTAAEGNVQAKTGSMSYVNALAGYVTTKSGQRLAFSVILNNYKPTQGAATVSSEVDAIAVMLAETPEHL
ncbi:D-alanyl-D-alanine carboxypeptidase/D-alanyl-D-alanine-endopeptidase [Luteibacter aegosomaticola]|uniref:D-alanyl-D-alanine carboxypeptidase/D-alanyl-D-alanine endopeptidase n=1 Tax=Luteibacter aegosomaticola TaxID=2911538 RepID=UPI001FF804DA|nr:D-alanyl-D-alanine carboxypeptidase/D-alanyl-D-alanine-endopeptidase [Luteibacter aegosomaticola]UPG92040.1 D-alanyl-D-alanine carboxypeptidase/D-alanyl-D-alanine-endopeptidase [Luteibacter aegosomaticola]